MFEQTTKIVLAGPMGSGKTTTLQSLANHAPVSTDVPLSRGPVGGKTTTTVGLDFALVTLDDGTPLQMYGLPGQDHLSHMRPIVLNGALGVILLLSADSPDIIAECDAWLASIAEHAPERPVAIGITKSDHALDFRMDELREHLASYARLVPAFTIDARQPEEARQLVRALVYSIH